MIDEDEDKPEDDLDDAMDDGDLDDDSLSTAESLAEEEGQGRNQMIMIAAGVVILLVAVAMGLLFTGALDGLLGVEEPCVEEYSEDGELMNECPDEIDQSDDAGGQGEEGVEGATNFIEIPPMIVNLNSDDGTPRYLRLSVQLEMHKSGDVAAVEKVMPRVIDQFQTYLRELRVKDLRGSAGIYRLQTELLWRVNQAAHPIKVKDVLFQEILIQ